MSGFTLEFAFLGLPVTIPDIFQLSDEVLAVEWKTIDEIQVIPDARQFRCPGQVDIMQMICRNQLMSMESFIERISNPSPEARE